MDIQNISVDMYRPQLESSGKFQSRDISRTSSAPASAMHGDRVSVSRDAVLRTEAFSTAMSAADTRQEKIDSIKQEIASGRYKIDNHRIAANLLQTELALFN